MGESIVTVPSYFCCPISLEVMPDPVTLSSGHTYDRCSIEKWFSAGNWTCPSSMQKVDTLDLIPNLTLRRLIQEWCERHRTDSRLDRSEGVLPRMASSDELNELLDDIQEGHDRISSLRKLTSLSQACEGNRQILLEEGAVSVLGSLLAGRSVSRTPSKLFSKHGPFDSYKDEINEACEEALATLALLVDSDREQRITKIAGPRQMNAIACFLCEGSTSAKVNAALVLHSMTWDDELIRDSASEVEGIMKGLVGLLKANLNAKIVVAGLKSLHDLCLLRKYRQQTVEAGAIPTLIELLPGSTRLIAERALSILQILSTSAEGRAALTTHAMSISVIIRCMNHVSDTAAEHATVLLRNMLIYSAPHLHRDAVSDGAFPQLLLVIQRDCNRAAKLAARELMKLLQTTCKSDPCISTTMFA